MLSAYAVLDVGLPSLGHGPQVKEFNVAIIISSTHTTFSIIV